MYRLLIADDEESIREGVADFVRQNCPEWDVAALARDGREALALAREIDLPMLKTPYTMFEACARLYTAGLRPVELG